MVVTSIQYGVDRLPKKLFSDDATNVHSRGTQPFNRAKGDSQLIDVVNSPGRCLCPSFGAEDEASVAFLQTAGIASCSSFGQPFAKTSGFISGNTSFTSRRKRHAHTCKCEASRPSRGSFSNTKRVRLSPRRVKHVLSLLWCWGSASMPASFKRILTWSEIISLPTPFQRAWQPVLR